MVTARQIKAARALLGWTQADLARAAGLHPNVVLRLESEKANPRATTLQKIKQSCEEAGLHFRGQRGVEMKEDLFETQRFEGPDFIRRLTDDCLRLMKSPADEVLNVVTDEVFFDLADAGQNKRFYAHMSKTGFRERYLVTQQSAPPKNKDQAVYRRLPQEALGTIAYVVYANRVGFLQWRTREVLLIKNAALAQTFRDQFTFLWNMAR